MNVRALQLNSCSYWQLFLLSVQNGLHIAYVCALLLRIRKDRRKKRQWLHPEVSNGRLNGQFYKLYEDFRNCNGKFFNYFRMSIWQYGKM